MPDGYQVVELANFGGLDLRRDPQDPQPIRALAMNNVLIEPGKIRMRPGTTKLVSQSTTTEWTSLRTHVRTATNNPYLITVVPSTGQLRTYDASTGAFVHSTTVAGASLPASIAATVQISYPTSTPTTYISVQGATAHPIRYAPDSGTPFSVSTLWETPKFMAVQRPDNRLAMGNFTSGTTTPSRVHFSLPNDPDNFDLADYVDLVPGDGEQIVGLESFREFLVAFKQSAFYVFYGNSTDSVGGTIFNYRTVKHNLAVPAYAGKVTAAGREGIYFLAKDGIYLTDGGYPHKVSAPLDPLFIGSDHAGYFDEVAEIGGGTFPNLYLEYAGGRLYLRLGNNSFFVYDPQLDAWMYWDMYSSASGYSIVGLTPVLLAGANEEIPYFLTVTGSSPNRQSIISYLNHATIQDQAHALSYTIASYYRTNFMDLGQAGTLKKIRATEIEGLINDKAIGYYPSNAASLTGADYFTYVTSASIPTGATTWPEYYVGHAWARQAHRGRNFSLGIGFPNNQGAAAWAVHRVLIHVRAQRAPGRYATVTTTGE